MIPRIRPISPSSDDDELRDFWSRFNERSAIISGHIAVKRELKIGQKDQLSIIIRW